MKYSPFFIQKICHLEKEVGVRALFGLTSLKFNCEESVQKYMIEILSGVLVTWFYTSLERGDRWIVIRKCNLLKY